VTALLESNGSRRRPRAHKIVCGGNADLSKSANVRSWQIVLQKSAVPSNCATFESNQRAAGINLARQIYFFESILRVGMLKIVLVTSSQAPLPLWYAKII
jgi:hypothetical protein